MHQSNSVLPLFNLELEYLRSVSDFEVEFVLCNKLRAVYQITVRSLDQQISTVSQPNSAVYFNHKVQMETNIYNLKYNLA